MTTFAQPAVTNAAAATIDPSDFTTHINNPYFRLTPGTTFIYNDVGTSGADRFTVTYDTVVIMGVTCLVVHDVGTVNGLVVEDTYDWFAQDNQGNVWYFGEASAQFEPGNPIPIGTEGSWQAGVDGALPGIVMEANPQVGDLYREEFAPGVAEDKARVLSIDSTVDVVYGSFDGALKTRNFTPLDPGDVEKKYYVPGVGFVLGTDADGGREQLVAIKVDGLAGDDRLEGYAGGDQMNGYSGDDRMFGRGGNDVMNGGSGNDRLQGNQGADTLNGASGNDFLTGGAEADRFLFKDLSNGFAETDTIADYHKSQVDVIDLPHGLQSIASDSFVGGAWQLTLAGDGDVIILAGLNDTNQNGHIVDELLVV